MNSDTITFSLSIVGMILTFQTMVLVAFSYLHYSTKKFERTNYFPLVSVIVPCYNEALTLKNCITSILSQTYKNYEILIIDDGSTDSTLEVANSLSDTKIRTFTKPNGGKASALNYGIERSNGEIIVSLDADSIFLPNTLSKLISPFSDPEIIAVCGNIKISNRNTLLTKLQSLEYISGLNIQRRAFAYLNCMQIISGAIGAFRKTQLVEVGGYSRDTLVEDMDVTVTLAKKGYKIEYISSAIAYTESPESLHDFHKQRYRWSYGLFEVIQKHKPILFKTTRIGIIGLPYILISLILETFLTLSIPLIMVVDIFFNLSYNTLAIFLMVLLSRCIIFLYTFHLDKENKKLILFTPIYMVYIQYVNLITIKALFHFTTGKKASWNKIKRLGKNTLPVHKTRYVAD